MAYQPTPATTDLAPSQGGNPQAPCDRLAIVEATPLPLNEESLMAEDSEESYFEPRTGIEWTDWDPDPESKAATSSKSDRLTVQKSWRGTIVASCIEPEGPRRLFGIAVRKGDDVQATLRAAIERVVGRINQAESDDAHNEDALGGFVPGAVIRDVTISMGEEVLAIVKGTLFGPCVIRLPRTDQGRLMDDLGDLVLERGGEPVVEMAFYHFFLERTFYHLVAESRS